MTNAHRMMIYIIVLSFLCVFISCEKDPVRAPMDHLIIDESQEMELVGSFPTFPLFSTIPFAEAYPIAHRYFEAYMEDVNQNNRSDFFYFDDIDVNNYIAHESAEGTSYVWYLPAANSNSKTYYNLVFEAYPDRFDEPFILAYELSDAFHDSFANGQASLDEFSGLVKKYLLSQVLPYRSEDFEFCYQLFFGDNGGGHGAYQDGPGTGKTPTSSGSTNEGLGASGIGALFGVCIECVECTCESHPCGTGSCTCGENGNGSKWYYVMSNCGSSNLVQNQNDLEMADQSRGILEDCYKALLECGIMPPGYVNHNPDDELEEEECVPSFMQFIEDNNLSLKDLKMKGVDFAACCEADDQLQCNWTEVEEAYGFNFSYEDFVNLVRPVLKEFEWKLDHLTNNGVDINECVASDDFRSCSWEQLIYETMPEDDFSEEEIQFTAENPPQDSKAGLITKDWSTLNDDQRLQHAITELRRMVWIHRCQLENKVNYYRLDEPDGVFSNVSGQGASYTHNADITINLDSGPEIIPNVGWGWSVGTNSGQTGIDYQTYRSTLYDGESATFPVWHYYFVRKYASDPIDHTDACIDFTCPTEYASKMYEWFNSSCKN